MYNQSEEKAGLMREFEEQHKELMQYKEEYELRKKEREKREEIAMIMKQKKEEQEKEHRQLERAAEWIQAHWRGLIARKDASRIGKKGKKKKKK